MNILFFHKINKKDVYKMLAKLFKVCLRNQQPQKMFTTRPLFIFYLAIKIDFQKLFYVDILYTM